MSATSHAALQAPQALRVAHRAASSGSEPTVLADIYDETTNIAIWQRTLPAELQAAASALVESRWRPELALQVRPESVESDLNAALGAGPGAIVSRDIAELVNMFCCLLGLRSAGLRLTALARAMCPRFHVDHVPCRLVTTYQGAATDWLPHDCVDRTKLGPGSQGLPDAESGLYAGPADVQRLTTGDVALLKGERWAGNENAGLVHRSPAVTADAPRLLLTLDIGT